MTELDSAVLFALGRVLLRAGVITDDQIRDEMENMERSGRTEEARHLFLMLLNASSPSASEYEADFRRRQMVERTALIERRAQAEREGLTIRNPFLPSSTDKAEE